MPYFKCYSFLLTEVKSNDCEENTYCNSKNMDLWLI